MNIKQNGYPVFWKYIKDEKFKGKINKELECPMNYLCELKFDDSRSNEETLPMDYFFKKFKLKEDRRKSKKVENLIEKYSLLQYNALKNYDKNKENDDYLLLMNDYDKLINEIKNIYISRDYLGLYSWLINRAFIITDKLKINSNKIDRKTNNNKSLFLKILYDINKENLLECFSGNIDKHEQNV